MWRRAGLLVLAFALALASAASCPCGPGGCPSERSVEAAKRGHGCCAKEGIRRADCCDTHLQSPGVLTSDGSTQAAPRATWLLAVTAGGDWLRGALPVLAGSRSLERGFAPPGTLHSSYTLLLL